MCDVKLKKKTKPEINEEIKKNPIIKMGWLMIKKNVCDVK